MSLYVGYPHKYIILLVHELGSSTFGMTVIYSEGSDILQQEGALIWFD